MLLDDMSMEEESFRKLLAARPDVLIVEHDHDDDVRKRLMISGIECVRMGATKWQEQLRQIAEVLDKQELCEQWIHTYESRAAHARESISHSAWDDLFVTLRISGAQIYLGGCIVGRSRRLTCCLYYQMAPEYCLKCPKQ